MPLLADDIEALRKRLGELGTSTAAMALEAHRNGNQQVYGHLHDAINRMALAMNRLTDARNTLAPRDDGDADG